MGAAKAETVSIHDLCLSYRGGVFGQRRIRAIEQLSLAIGPGLVGVVGPNGSGKSSLFRCILGLEQPDRGRVEVLGHAAGHRPTLRRVGYVAEGRLPLGRLTAREFLTLAGTLGGDSVRVARERAAELLARVGLEQAADRAHGKFSSGMERRLAFAQALYADCELLVLDEPTAGMDPLAIETVRATIADRVRAGCTVLVATHGLEDFGDSFDRIVVLFEGRVVADGAPDDVLGEPDSHAVTVSGLDRAGEAAVRETAKRHGGAVLRDGRTRRSLAKLLLDIVRPGNKP